MPFEDLINHYSVAVNPIPTGFRKSGTITGVIKAVLFDVYGTLFISRAGDISTAEEEATNNIIGIERLLKKYRIDRKASLFYREFIDEIEREMGKMKEGGVDYPEVVIEKIWKTILPMKDDDFIERFAVEYEMIVNPVYPMPHAHELLSSLKKKNALMGIISNAQFYTPYLFPALLGGSIADLGFRNDLTFFSYVFGYGKPSLFLFRKAAECLDAWGIRRKNVLFVGNDMLKDIYPASAMGFQTALFAGDSRSLRLRKDDERCKNLAAALIITDLLHIDDYI
ncbi:MAG: HAD family hydrolase [Deltaproteobacteria bacterium]|nr:HAD family hydrolase [Deltaproteobacteria bacterium]